MLLNLKHLYPHSQNVLAFIMACLIFSLSVAYLWVQLEMRSVPSNNMTFQLPTDFFADKNIQLINSESRPTAGLCKV